MIEVLDGNMNTANPVSGITGSIDGTTGEVVLTLDTSLNSVIAEYTFYLKIGFAGYKEIFIYPWNTEPFTLNVGCSTTIT